MMNAKTNDPRASGWSRQECLDKTRFHFYSQNKPEEQIQDMPRGYKPPYWMVFVKLGKGASGENSHEALLLAAERTKPNPGNLPRKRQQGRIEQRKAAEKTGEYLSRTVGNNPQKVESSGERM